MRPDPRPPLAPLPCGMTVDDLKREWSNANVTLLYHRSRRGWSITRYDGRSDEVDARIREAEHRVRAISRLILRRTRVR